jgi:hypothetical protein
MLQLDRARQSQFEEGFGEGRQRHRGEVWGTKPQVQGSPLEVRRLRGSVGQKIREYRVWSIECRVEKKFRVAGGGLGWQVAGIGRGVTVSRPRLRRTRAPTRHYLDTGYVVTRSRPYLG